jgi:TRAP-type C4-dicarboxylate transport system permease small subunit
MFGGGGKDIASINRYAQNVLNALVYISGALAITAVIYGGIMYMLSAGDEKRAQTAKRIIMYALVGVAVIVGSYFIISLTTTFFK